MIRRFSTELFARYQRSEKALASALAEMYVQGVSPRRVKAITEELRGRTFSASTISHINASLDGMLRHFAERKLDEAYPYLVSTRATKKVRLDGVIQTQAVLVAIGINWDDRRWVLRVELSNRESRSSWSTFVKGLKARGLHGVEFVVSDDHAGLKRRRAAAARGRLAAVLVHFLRNALDYLPRKADGDCRQELPWPYDRPRPEGGATRPAGVAPALGAALSAPDRRGRAAGAPRSRYARSRQRLPCPQ